MARRDLSTPRTVVQQAVEQPTNFAGIAAEIGQEIITNSQKAKINEGLSQAQLDLERLNNEYRTAAQGDPFNQELLTEYKEARQNRFDELGEQISPFFREEWNEKVRRLESQSDISNQAWGFKQAKVNTIQSINNTIQNNMALAAEAGRDAAVGATTDVEALLQFGPAKAAITETARGILGETELAPFLDTYEEDYLKNYISGMAEQNPTKALQLLEDPRVKESITHAENYSKFKSAVEQRGLNKNKLDDNLQILNTLKDKNNILSKSSLDDPIPFATLQTEFDKKGYSKETQDFFKELNGYATSKTTLSPEAKQQTKLKIVDDLARITQSDNITSEDLASFQDSIYRGLSTKSITPTQGDQLLLDFLDPLITTKEAELKAHGDSSFFFGDSIGFDALKEFYEEEVEVIPFDDAPKELQRSQNLQNDTRRLQLYELYFSELQNAASANNTSIVGLGTLGTKDEIYTRAFERAKSKFAKKQFPTLAGIKGDVTDILTKEGQKIRLFGEISDKAKKAAADFKITDMQTGLVKLPTGERARLFKKKGKAVRMQILEGETGISVVEDIFFDSNGNPL